MPNYNGNSVGAASIVGKISSADPNAGFQSEVKGVFESYAAQGTNLIQDLGSVIAAPSSREAFVGAITESMSDSPLFTNAVAAKDPFYSSYTGCVEQLLENTLSSIATEAVMTGYAPIVAYNPFFLKKQWIDCVFKDVLMTEIPKTPVINIGFERNYAIDGEGNRYPLPEALYNADTVKKLMNEATGLNIKEDPIDITTMKNLCLLDPTYIPGVVTGDHTAELTANMIVFKVVMKDIKGTTHEVATNIQVDVTTCNLIGGKVSYKVLDEDGNVTETLEDEILGHVDFTKGTITCMSTTGATTHVCLRGKTANRWNKRSLSVERKVERIEKVMPESGPRINTAITLEEAADALALQNIDMVAYNINLMGGMLANFEDAEIHQFLQESAAAQKLGQNSFVAYNELDPALGLVETEFNLLPYDTFNGRVTEWMKDAREWFERTIAAMKVKLRSTNMMIVAVCNPNVVRFLQDGINWVFSDDTSISGVKLSYQFGIYTTAQDRVHVVTTMRMPESEGIRFVAIPLTNELITYKHYKYNVMIDRNYRNPVYDLVPNIMATQRTLTFEILPVQGVMTVVGNNMHSPETLRRGPYPVEQVGGGTTPGGDTPVTPGTP